MAADLGELAVATRLREACRRMALPIVVRDVDAIAEADVAARLRTACSLWAMCAQLGDLAPQAR